MKSLPVSESSRKIIDNTIRSISETAPTEEYKSRLDITSILETLDFIDERQEQAYNDSHKMIGDILLTARLYIAGLGTLAIASYYNEDQDSLFPSTWASTDGVPNPNLVLRSQLIQLANYALSVINLCALGLDNPARTLCRATGELAHQTLVIFSNPNEFMAWVQGDDPSASNKVWYKLFAKNLLSKKLKTLESQLCKQGSDLDIIQKERQESYAFNSMAVHHSFINTIAGSHSLINQQTDELDYSLFGRASTGSENTIHDLATHLHYFTSMFFNMLLRFHKFRPKDFDNSPFLESFATIEAAKNLLISLESSDA